MSKLSRTISAGRSDRHAASTLPAWMIADLKFAEPDHLAPQPMQLGLPQHRPWQDQPIEGETDGMLILDL